ncbi:MAG TPA: hypothetical protein VHZ07_00950 [Bryobacteraceae bacterium]|jgi:hypothetical protein|nr:hypothetical protein [Bryobacteraceae bacterium]
MHTPDISPASRARGIAANHILIWRIALITWCVVLTGCIGFSAFRNLVFVSSDGFDEPILVITAARVARGEMPFRDFDAYYGPLGHYLDAAAILIQSGIPPTTACQRLFFLLSLAILGLLGWWIPRLIAKRGWLLLWAAVFLGLFGPMIGRFSFNSGIELLLILATLLLVPLESDVPILEGSAIAFAALDVVLFAIKINFGVYAIAATAFLLLLDAFIFRRRRAVRTLAIYCSALFAFGGIATVAMWISGMLLPYTSIIWDAIRLNYARHVALAFLAPATLVQCVGLLFLFLLLCALAAFDPILRRNRTLVYALALSAGFTQYAVFRFDRYHIFFLLFGLFTALLVTLRLYGMSLPRRRRLPWIAGVGLAILCLAALPDTLVHRIARFDSQLVPAAATAVPSQPRAWPVRDGVAISRGELHVISSLRSAMNPGDEVFWASKPGSCQSVTDACVNHALYLAMGRLPTTRYWMFDVVTSQYPGFQEQMVRDIEERKIRFIGLQENLLRQPLGTNPPESQVLYDFVRSHYGLIGTFNAPGRLERFEIYRLNTR